MKLEDIKKWEDTELDDTGDLNSDKEITVYVAYYYPHFIKFYASESDKDEIIEMLKDMQHSGKVDTWEVDG